MCGGGPHPARGPSVHVVSKHPPIDVARRPPGAVGVPAVVPDTAGPQIPSAGKNENPQKPAHSDELQGAARHDHITP